MHNNIFIYILKESVLKSCRHDGRSLACRVGSERSAARLSNDISGGNYARDCRVSSHYNTA